MDRKVSPMRSDVGGCAAVSFEFLAVRRIAEIEAALGASLSVEQRTIFED